MQYNLKLFWRITREILKKWHIYILTLMQNTNFKNQI